MNDRTLLTPLSVLPRLGADDPAPASEDEPTGHVVASDELDKYDLATLVCTD